MSRLILVAALTSAFLAASSAAFAQDRKTGSYKAWRLDRPDTKVGKGEPLLVFSLSPSKVANTWTVMGTLNTGKGNPAAIFKGTYRRKSKSLDGTITKLYNDKGKLTKIELAVSGKYDPASNSFDITLRQQYRDDSSEGVIWASDISARHVSYIEALASMKSKPEPRAFTPAGSWSHKTEQIGNSTWIVKDEGNGYFTAKESGLGGVQASKVTWNGSTLRIEFDFKSGWAGFYSWTINSKTKTGEGHLTITRGRVGTYTSTVKQG